MAVVGVLVLVFYALRNAAARADESIAIQSSQEVDRLIESKADWQKHTKTGSKWLVTNTFDPNQRCCELKSLNNAMLLY